MPAEDEPSDALDAQRPVQVSFCNTEGTPQQRQPTPCSYAMYRCHVADVCCFGRLSFRLHVQVFVCVCMQRNRCLQRLQHTDAFTSAKARKILSGGKNKPHLCIITSSTRRMATHTLKEGRWMGGSFLGIVGFLG